MTALRLIAAAAACALLGMQALADAADGAAQPAGQPGASTAMAAFQFDGPESSGVKDGARIALTGKPIDGMPTATKPPSATRPLHAGTVTTPTTAATPPTSGDAAAGSLPLAELGALVLAGLLAVVTVTRRRTRR